MCCLTAATLHRGPEDPVCLTGIPTSIFPYHDGLRARLVIPIVEHGDKVVRFAIVVVVVYQAGWGFNRETEVVYIRCNESDIRVAVPDGVVNLIEAVWVCVASAGKVVFVPDFDVVYGPWFAAAVLRSHTSVGGVGGSEEVLYGQLGMIVLSHGGIPQARS